MSIPSVRFVAVRFAAALALTGLAAGACTPIRESHGWVADSSSENAAVQPGVDTKSTVMARMGSPSTTANFGANDWYYITALQQNFAYFKPKTTARKITVVRFNTDDVVASVDQFGLEKGKVINYSGQKTPTRGRELGLLEQIFGTVGTQLPIPEDDRNRGGADRR
jgi:outer membrane protein assembly factor BamE (lipoprotein component of BamABCDE complex)